MEWNPCHGARSYVVQTEAAKNNRMIGLPHSFKVALFCEISEAKSQASMQGVCRASDRPRWNVDLEM